MNCYHMSPKRMLERPFPVRKQSLHSSKKRGFTQLFTKFSRQQLVAQNNKKENKTWKKNESLLLDQGRQD